MSYSALFNAGLSTLWENDSKQALIDLDEPSTPGTPTFNKLERYRSFLSLGAAVASSSSSIKAPKGRTALADGTNHEAEYRLQVFPSSSSRRSFESTMTVPPSTRRGSSAFRASSRISQPPAPMHVLRRRRSLPAPKPAPQTTALPAVPPRQRQQQWAHGIDSPVLPSISTSSIFSPTLPFFHPSMSSPTTPMQTSRSSSSGGSRQSSLSRHSRPSSRRLSASTINTLQFTSPVIQLHPDPSVRSSSTGRHRRAKRSDALAQLEGRHQPYPPPYLSSLSLSSQSPRPPPVTHHKSFVSFLTTETETEGDDDDDQSSGWDDRSGWIEPRALGLGDDLKADRQRKRESSSSESRSSARLSGGLRLLHRVRANFIDLK